MVYLTISTGIGGGAVINGRLHRGAAGNGGEYGHIMVQRGGRHCLCGRRGCLETYASGTSIAERAREALQRGPRIRAVVAPGGASRGRRGRGRRGRRASPAELWTETTRRCSPWRSPTS